ncbi:MAG: IS256 family transposase [Anaerolineae bacterium]|nr:IS256 family transposase [Anaerolineae bacterium]
MTELSVALQEYLRKAGVEWDGDLLRDGLIVLLQALMEAEVSQQVGAERYARSEQRQTYRNGFRETEWETRVGEIPLRIPKLRSGSYYPSFLEPRRRTERALLAVIQAAYIEGVSTRKVDELVQALGLTGIDKSKVSRICQELDGAVQAFRERHLGAAYPYVWLDATYVKVRENHRIVSKAVVIAIGVRESGEREILGLEIGGSEEEAFWTQSLRSLVARGLTGVELVISDAHAGLTAAVTKVMSGASWQRCRVHFMRNVLTHVPKGDKSMAAAAIRTIFAQPNADAAHQQLEEVAKAMEPRWSKAAEVLLAGEDEVLTYMAFPPEHWTRIYSTNPLERLNREIKRRTDVVGIFPDSAAVMRLVGSILIEANDEWQAGRRYFSQASMRKLHEPLEAAMPALPSPIPVAPIH